MGRVKALKSTMSEAVTQAQLSSIEKVFDKLFAKVGINLEFTKHFFDRVNDPRNQPELTIEDLIEIFGDAYKKYGKKIADLGNDAQAVLKDIETDVNVPFVLVYNKAKQQLDMFNKTIMRKAHFTTGTSTVFKV